MIGWVMCQASRCGFATCRGPVWRYARPGADQNRERLKLVDPNCFSWPRPVRSVCPYRSSTSLIDGRERNAGFRAIERRSGHSTGTSQSACRRSTPSGSLAIARISTARAYEQRPDDRGLGQVAPGGEVDTVVPCRQGGPIRHRRSGPTHGALWRELLSNDDARRGTGDTRPPAS